MEKWVVTAKKADFQGIGRKYGIDPVIARIIRKADILETEPDIKKHEDSSNDNGNYCISSHLIADSSGNALCLDQRLIYIKLIHKCLVQSFTLIQSQCDFQNFRRK